MDTGIAQVSFPSSPPMTRIWTDHDNTDLGGCCPISTGAAHTATVSRREGCAALGALVLPAQTAPVTTVTPSVLNAAVTGGIVTQATSVFSSREVSSAAPTCTARLMWLARPLSGQRP